MNYELSQPEPCTQAPRGSIGNSFRATDCTEPSRRPFDDLMASLSQNNAVLGEIIDNVGCAIDRLIGSVPECASARACDQVALYDGALGEGFSIAARGSALNDRLQYLMGRLNQVV